MEVSPVIQAALECLGFKTYDEYIEQYRKDTEALRGNKEYQAEMKVWLDASRKALGRLSDG